MTVVASELYARLADQYLARGNALLDRAERAEAREETGTSGVTYVDHEDIMAQNPIDPDFSLLNPHPERFTSPERNAMQHGSAYGAGTVSFARQFKGRWAIFPGQKRTGQEALDIIVSSGLAEPEEAKGVLNHLCNNDNRSFYLGLLPFWQDIQVFRKGDGETLYQL